MRILNQLEKVNLISIQLFSNKFNAKQCQVHTLRFYIHGIMKKSDLKGKRNFVSLSGAS